MQAPKPSVLARVFLILSGLVCLAFPASLQAASVLEEVVVTAQRAEENLQDVPIAVTALTGEMLEDRGVINPSDLQRTAPNVSFTATNFGGSSFSIRGIGRLVIGATADSGVSTHINEIPLESNLNAIEFFDMERVEVLRGPQGTLYGRNATGGTINTVTRMPDYDALDGFVDVELGDYSHQRVKGAINVPLTSNMGLRFAGFDLQRDGYIRNRASGSVSTMDNTRLPNIDSDIDGRDIQAWRATWAWDFLDNASIWVQYSKFEEDDDRARITNQVCVRTDLPALGCEPNEVGYDAPHLGSTTGGLFFMLNGQNTLQLGARGINGQDGLVYDHVAPNLDLRSMFTDFEPVFMYEEEIWSLGADWDLGPVTLSVLGAIQETSYLSQMDYNMDVGPLLGPNPTRADGLWLTSAPAGGPSGDVRGANGCRYADGTAGIFGGCTVGDGLRNFAMDQASSENEYWTGEFRVASNFEGPVNFQAGVTAYERQYNTDYYVNANGLDSVGQVGVGAIGFPPLYPTMFNVPSSPFNKSTNEGVALFGEVYWYISERIKFTAGLRYNEDDKFTSSANAFLSSLNQAVLLNASYLPAFGNDASVAVGLGLLDPDYEAALASLPGGRWGRGTCIMLPSQVTCGTEDGSLNAATLAQLNFHGVTQAQIDAANASLPFSPERAVLLNALGPITGFNEVRTLNGNPDSTDWSVITGRVGVDYRLTDEMLLYGFFSRGYKPGGFNPPIAPEFQDDTAFAFDEEEVDSLEIGYKATLLDGQLLLNANAFIYDYTGLQVTRIRNNSSINENIDADISGLELEWAWEPLGLENFAIDGSLSWLNTELKDVRSVDVTNKGADDPNWINLKNIDPGATTGANYVAWAPDITPEIINAAYTRVNPVNDMPAPAALSHVNFPSAAEGTVYENGIPAYFSRNFLTENGVRVSSGIAQNISGNQLPNAPELTLRVGLQYTWNVPVFAGDITLRWDYYWQDDSYAREFNTVGDQIDSWDQHNLTVLYESSNGEWQGRFWVRNLQDENNITGHYLTSDTSGYFRNYFLTEPRVYGLTMRYQFNGQ